MCVGILVPYPNTEKGEVYRPLSLETLEACERANSAGGGIAWVTKNGVFFKKGLTAKEIFELQKPLQPPYQIHFRIPTTGGNSKELCHPFPVSKKASLALEGYAGATLIHNGHWGQWKDTLLNLLVNDCPPAPWSDTRAMAYLVAHYKPPILDLIDEKVSLLFADGSYKFYGKGWQEHEGAYFTNLSWKARADFVKANPSVVQGFREAGFQSGIKGNRAGYKSQVEDAEFTVWSKDDEELALIKEWARWVGLKTEVVDLAIAEAKGARRKAIAAAAEALVTRNENTQPMLLK